MPATVNMSLARDEFAVRLQQYTVADLKSASRGQVRSVASPGQGDRAPARPECMF